MKLLIVTAIFPPDIGGPATYSYSLAQNLSKKHQVQVVTFTRNPQPVGQKVRITSVEVKGGSVRRQYRLLRTIWQQSKQIEVMYAQDPLVVGLAALLVSLVTGKPLIIKFVGDIVWESARNENRFTGSLEKYYQSKLSVVDRIKIRAQSLVLKRARGVIVPANYLKNFLVNQYQIPEKKVTVIYNGVEVSKRKEAKKDPYLAVTVARLVSWKNIAGILKAVKSIPKLKYHVAGDGPERESLEKLVNDLEIQDRVKFLGSLDKEKIERLLEKSTYFILNSSYEGLSHVLLEAAANKNVIVTPKLPGILEIFSQKEALLFKPQNQRDLEKAVSQAVGQHKNSRLLAERAYHKIENRFTWEETFEKTKSLLDQLVENANSKAM